MQKISGIFFVQHVAQQVGACTSAMLRCSLASSFGHAHSLQLIVFFSILNFTYAHMSIPLHKSYALVGKIERTQ